MSDSSQSEDINQRSESIIISEDYPIIESTTESSILNRMGKFIRKVGQHEWISEMDLFSIPMKLNINGNQTFKTEFGGLTYIAISFICILVTITSQFPNGLIFKNPITFYSTIQDTGNTQTVFDYSDTFFEFYLFNQAQNRKANSTEYDFFLKSASVFQVNGGVAERLELSMECSIGVVCFKYSELNANTYIYGSSGNNQTSISFQIQSCALFDFDPVFGLCYTALLNYINVVAVTSFSEVTGNIVPSTTHIVLTPSSGSSIFLDSNQYTTNNNIMGYIANLFSYQLNYYEPRPSPSPNTQPLYDTNFNCFSWVNFNGFGGNGCTWVSLTSSGTTNIYTQNFQNITTPILVFLSISQTCFYIIWILILRNYSNNALHLRIADSLVFIPNNNRHYNFKNGIFCFVACLMHNNILIQALDYILYSTLEIHTRKILPLKGQFAIKMMDFGEKCLGEDLFFTRINQIYEQENLLPTKIIFQDEEETQQEKGDSQKEQILQQNEQGPYFDNQTDQEAFRRMCKDHQIYTNKRKKYLSCNLKRSDKNYKLLLYTQSIFQQYRRQVRLEYCAREVQLPVDFNLEDQSAIQIRKTTH